MAGQRLNAWPFDAIVSLIGATRFARAGAPALAMMLAVVVASHGVTVVTLTPEVPGLAMDVPPGWNVERTGPRAHAARPYAGERLRAEPAGAASASGANGVAGDDAESPHPMPALSKEQMNVARFIAGTYRIAIDSTADVVHHAFRAARDIKVDPFLILAVMSVESSFNPKAQSNQGAQGLMQVLTRVHADKFMPFGGITAAFDPVANIRVGSAILKGYLDREGSVEGALKSYVGASMAPSDGGYGSKVLFERERIVAAAAGRPVPTEPPPAAREIPAVVMQPVVASAGAVSVRVDAVSVRVDAVAAADPVRTVEPARSADAPARTQGSDAVAAAHDFSAHAEAGAREHDARPAAGAAAAHPRTLPSAPSVYPAASDI